MHYYRFRPYSELSLKELLYSEVYFASNEECNDPYDSMVFTRFSKDKEKWAKLIVFALKGKVKFGQDEEIPIELFNSMVEHACNKCPITYEEVCRESIFTDFTPSDIKYVELVELIKTKVQEVFEVYKPESRYFVSFSKVADEFLMWSHYANRHRGFCLIFKSIDNKLLMSPNFRKQQIELKTNGGIAESIGYTPDDKYNFIDVDYPLKVKPLDGFLRSPAFVYGKIKNKKTEEKLGKLQELHYKQKSRNWKYEKESRLILQPPPSWIYGRQIPFSKHQRLFHYEPSQLVGIIYGAKLEPSEQHRIMEVLHDRRIWYYNNNSHDHIRFNFVEFQAKLSSEQRNINISPFRIDYKMTKSHKDFERLLKEWKLGYGYERSKNGSKRIKVQ